MLHILQRLYTYVSSVCSDCFICFRHMLQVFHLDVAKVDLDAVYICMVASVCLRFKHMFLLFHLDVVYILQWLHMCFSGVSDVRCKCFSCFGRMLQMFHLDVAKIDLV